MKEDYENIKQMLIKINYAWFKWNVCGDRLQNARIPAGSAGWIHKILLLFVLVE